MMIVLLLALLIAAPAFATGGDKECPPGHENNNSCDNTGPPGEDGKDGVDGKDGRDGVDGKDGRDGIDGKDGRDGIDGIVDYRIIHKEFRTWRNYAAAMQAIQIHLPQDASQRLTLSGSAVNGTTGMGLGYAYKTDRDDNLAFTVGVGTAGGEQVGVISAGFEFGANRRSYDLQNRSYDANARRIEELERQLQILEEERQLTAERCRESNERVHEQCGRK